MADKKGAGGSKDPGGGGRRRTDAGSQSGTHTSVGIDDPVLQAELDEERAKIAAAQARIAKITGGRKSRTGSAASAMVAGASNVAYTESVHRHVEANLQPSTYLDPVTGKLRVVHPPTPVLPAAGSLLASLPEGPNLPPAPAPPSVIEISPDRPDSDPLVIDPRADGAGAVAGPSGRKGPDQERAAAELAAQKEKEKAAAEQAAQKEKEKAAAEQAAQKEKDKEKTSGETGEAGDDGDEGLDQGDRESKPKTGLVKLRTPGRLSAKEKAKTYQKLLLRSVENQYYYEIFITGDNDYEVGDIITLRTKMGKERQAEIIQMEQGSPGPKDATGLVQTVSTEESGKTSGSKESGEQKEKEDAPPRRTRAQAVAAAMARRTKGLDTDDRVEKEKPMGKKKLPPKQTVPAGEEPGYGTSHQAAEEGYADLDAAAQDRGIDVGQDEEEPAGLRQIWDWDEDMVRRARQLAKEVASMPQDQTLQTRGQLKIRELEAMLHSKTGTKPKAIPEMTTSEQRIHEERVTGHETDRELALMAARNSRVGAKTGLCNTRGIQLCMAKIDLHTHTLALVLQHLEAHRRILTKYDRPPMKQEEIRANPTLNPLLSGYIPIDNQLSAEEFFSSEERSYELHRWVLSKMQWDPSSFIPRLCDLVTTREYRIKYSYPGKQKMSNLIYIPERMAIFLFGVAETASRKYGGFNPEKAEEQLRVAFQASVVRKRNPAETDENAPRSKRTKRGTKKGKRAVFSSTEEDEEESSNQEDEDYEVGRFAEDFHDTLVDYRSYLATDDEAEEIDATKGE